MKKSKFKDSQIILIRAHRWRDRLESGEYRSFDDIAQAEQIGTTYD